MSRLKRHLRSAAPVALLLALTACSNGGADTAAPSEAGARISTAFELPEERAYPEGIAVDSRSGDVYVGSFTNGAIYRASANSPRAEIFLPSGTDGRQTANGL